jgi:hypothetical protein
VCVDVLPDYELDEVRHAPVLGFGDLAQIIYNAFEAAGILGNIPDA